MFNKQNGYEGELSLVANEVKKKKKTYAVQKKKKGKIGRDWNSRLKGNCNSCSQSCCTLLHSEENVVLNHLIFIVKFLIYENKMNDKDPSLNVFLVKRQAHLKDENLLSSRISESNVLNWCDWCSSASQNRTPSHLPHLNTSPKWSQYETFKLKQYLWCKY